MADERPHPSPYIAAVAREQALAVMAEHERRHHADVQTEALRRCPHCGLDITDQLDASYERGYLLGYADGGLPGS